MADTDIILTTIKESAAGTEKAIERLAKAIEQIPAIADRLPKQSGGQSALVLVAVVSIIVALLSPVYVIIASQQRAAVEAKSDTRERDETIKYLIDLRRYATDDQHEAMRTERNLMIEPLERRIRCLEAGEIHSEHNGG